jgi:hypothetical protein
MYATKTLDFLEGCQKPVRLFALTGVTAALVMGSFWARPAVAQDASAGARAVRLSLVEGQVRVTEDGQVIADPATTNLPLFEGTEIATGNDGKAEVQLEDGSVARISPNSTLTLTQLSQQGNSKRTAAVVNGGLVYLELQPSTDANRFVVSFGQVSLSARSYSVVRLNLDTPPGQVAVFSGDVQATEGSEAPVEAHGGQSLSFDDSGHSSLAETIAPDSWDGWNADLDQTVSQEQEQKTVASGEIANNQSLGASDLDANGNWYNVPSQGYVWSPYAASEAGFDPYGYGNWVYYPRFGYVFVSGYSWGYAPFACGNWDFYDGFGWGWSSGMGCNPWWGYGGRGWAFNYRSYPMGYRPPMRPHPGPERPGGGSGLALSHVIAVDRRQGGFGGSGVVRSSGPITIAGRVVEPLRPIAVRQPYSRGGLGFAARATGNGFGNTGRPSLLNQGPRPQGGQPGGYGARPSQPSRPQSGQPSHFSGGNMGGGGSSHVSSGGGGGGGSHPSGGGASHK